LAESEYKLSQIVRAVPSMLWVTGPGSEVTKVNQRALDYTGARLEDFLHLGWNKFIHPDDLSETINAFSHAIQSGTSYEAVHRLRRADGEYRWHHSLGEPLATDGDASSNGTVCLLTSMNPKKPKIDCAAAKPG
jgi:PAS domain S-box-containing protein